MRYDEHGWFDRVVPMLDGKVGAQRNVSSAREAGEILIHNWPGSGGRSHADARRAVLEALERYRDRDAVCRARDAFAKAVEDAGIAGRED